MKSICVALVIIFNLFLFVGKAQSQGISFRKPVDGGTITCTFDSRTCGNPNKYHTGVDYAPTNNQTDILAASCGVVSLIQRNNGSDHGFGNAVILKHYVVNSNGRSDTRYTMYAHLSSIPESVRVGRAVSKGQKIGVMGGTGYGNQNQWGKHLHFEVKSGNTLTNPSGQGTIYGYSPNPAAGYGYINPANVIGVWKATCATPAN
jgi:murein DD-endopeptidase MepM/ murein hydrolase activator NlpD